MQEQEQKRYHEMKVRQHLGPQDHQQRQQEPMPLPHSGSDKRAQKPVQPVPKLEAPQEILLQEDVTVVQLASLLGGLISLCCVASLVLVRACWFRGMMSQALG